LAALAWAAAGSAGTTDSAWAISRASAVSAASAASAASAVSAASALQLEERSSVSAAARLEAAHRVAKEVKGVMEGSGLDYFALSASQMTVSRQGRGATKGASPKKSKTVLLALEMCPLSWLLGIDRFYLGNIGLGIAKMSVCICTCGIGGIIWGFIDFVTIMTNALKKEEAISTLGMHATFGAEHVETAFVLAILDICLLPLFIGLVRFVWWWRKQLRMEKLKQAAMNSPHYGLDPHQVKGG